MLAFSQRQSKKPAACRTRAPPQVNRPNRSLELTRSTGYVVAQEFPRRDGNGTIMGLQSCIKENSRRISDATAGSRDYFELATTNLSLYRALRAAAERHARGRLLDAGAGRMAYRRMLEEFCASYESLDIAGPPEPLDPARATHCVRHVADLQRTGLPDGAVRFDLLLAGPPTPARAGAGAARNRAHAQTRRQGHPLRAAPGLAPQ